MDEKHPCEGCDYFGGWTKEVRSCNYCLITGKRRPCPFGKACTVRRDSKRSRQKAMTIKDKNAENT